MKNIKQVIKEVTPRNFEKAILVNKKILVENSYWIHCSIWVPKTTETLKNEPKICFTLTSGCNDVRIVVDDPEELDKILFEMSVFINKHKEKLRKAKINELAAYSHQINKKIVKTMEIIKKTEIEKTEKKDVFFDADEIDEFSN